MSFTVNTPQSIPHNDSSYKNWFPQIGNRLSFRVKVISAAYVALSSINKDTSYIYEVIISGWSNSRTGIWKRFRNTFNERLPEVERNTAGMLSGTEFRGFWIDWNDDGVLRLGREGERLPFLMYQLLEPFEINFIGIRSHPPATWIIDKPTNIWIPDSNGSVPDGALAGGEDRGTFVYVGRAFYEGELTPGKVLPSHNGIYIPFGGKEVHLSKYEVFISHQPGVWIRTSGNNIPGTAIVAGKTKDGENMYVGRVLHNGTLTPGKVVPSHGKCYISYDGEELSFEHYEILII